VDLLRASIKHRLKNFLFGSAALILGLFGSYLVVHSRLILQSRTSEILPGIGLYLPGSILLVIGGIVMMARSVGPMALESRTCLMCGSRTPHFLADPRFKNGKKMGDSYACESCGQKYLVQTPIESSNVEDENSST
jgi:hypothetical protein